MITPNPKTSGGARWNYLAAYGWALDKFGGDEAKAKAYLAELFRNVPVLDTGARGSTTTFAQRGLGDVLLAWENEAFLVLERVRRRQVRDRGADRRASWPSRRSRVVDGNVDAKGTRKVAEAYLEYLYSPAGQALAAKHLLSPDRRRSARRRTIIARFPKIELFGIDKFGGWKEAQAAHFGDGGVFDQIYKPTN